MRITRGANLIVVRVPGLIATASRATAQPGGSVLLGTLLEPDQKTPQVSTEELRRFLAGGQTLILDARPFLEYAVSHIPGAINVAAKPGVPISVYVSDVREIRQIGRMIERVMVGRPSHAAGVGRPSRGAATWCVPEHDRR